MFLGAWTTISEGILRIFFRKMITNVSLTIQSKKRLFLKIEMKFLIAVLQIFFMKQFSAAHMKFSLPETFPIYRTN